MKKLSYSLRKNKLVGLAPVLLSSAMLITPTIGEAVSVVGEVNLGLQTVYAAEITDVTLSNFVLKNDRGNIIESGAISEDNQLKVAFKVKSNSPTNKGDILTIRTNDFRFRDRVLIGREIKDSSGKLIGVIKNVQNTQIYDKETSSLLSIELADNFNSFEFDAAFSVATDVVYYTKNPTQSDKSAYVSVGDNESNKVNYKFQNWIMQRYFDSRVDTEISDEKLKTDLKIWFRELFDDNGNDIGIPEGVAKLTLPEGFKFNDNIKVGDTLESGLSYKIESNGKVIQNLDGTSLANTVEVVGKTDRTLSLKVPKQDKDSILKWYTGVFENVVDVTDSSKAINTSEKSTNAVLTEFIPNDPTDKSYEAMKAKETKGLLLSYYLDGSAKIRTTPTTVIYMDGDKPVGTEDKGNRIPGEKIVDLNVPDGYERVNNDVPEVPSNGKIIVPVKQIKKPETPKEEPPVAKKTTKYIDDKGNLLKEKDGIHDKEEISGYKYMTTKTSEDGNLVEHIYHKIQIMYVDEEGNPITEEEGNDPSKYTFVREEVDPKTGDITRIYHKVVTKFVDENGKVIQEKDGVHDKEDLDGFEFERTEKLENGDVIHHYKKKEAPKELPKTGEVNSATISLVGIGLLGAIGVSTLKKKKEEDFE